MFNVCWLHVIVSLIPNVVEIRKVMIIFISYKVS